MSQETLICNIDEMLLEKFYDALVHSNENQSEVIAELISDYLSRNTAKPKERTLSGTVKITNAMTERAYEIAKQVHFGRLGRIEGKAKITEETGMNPGSAGDYITDLLAMMEGKKYTRTLNAFATRYFLLNIRKDFGEEAFQRALNATSEHLTYYNSLGHGKLNSIQEILDELR